MFLQYSWVLKVLTLRLNQIFLSKIILFYYMNNNRLEIIIIVLKQCFGLLQYLT